MLIFLIAFIIIVILVQKNSQKHALKGIKYDYHFSKKFIEIGEPTELISILTNESRRLVPFIRMVESLPKGVQILNNNVFIREATMKLGYVSYNSSVYLMARSKLQRKLKLTFNERGRYVFNGAHLHGGDFLGLTEKIEKFVKQREIIVYPKLITAPQLTDLLGGFLGDLSVFRFIMEDPILTIGTRDYTGREPLKQMSWKHIAQNNKMMVKQFDYTTEMVVTVFLDTSAVKGKTIANQQFETCFSLARSVCQHLGQQKIPFEFVLNATIEGPNVADERIIRGLGKAHLRAILEKLGRASYGVCESYEATIAKLALNQEKQRSVIIITPQRDSHKEVVAKQLKAKTVGTVRFIYGEDFDDIS